RRRPRSLRAAAQVPARGLSGSRATSPAGLRPPLPPCTSRSPAPAPAPPRRVDAQRPAASARAPAPFHVGPPASSLPTLGCLPRRPDAADTGAVRGTAPSLSRQALLRRRGLRPSVAAVAPHVVVVLVPERTGCRTGGRRRQQARNPALGRRWRARCRAGGRFQILRFQVELLQL
ncbi:hypothetical protein U9M48_042009, partial [Paspalum notatum var. saurae]